MPVFKDNFDIELTYSEQILTQDELHIGYVKLAKIK